MMFAGGSMVDFVGPLALAIVLVAIGVTFVRLVIGPDAADRIVALDLISILIVALVAIYSTYSRETAFFDVAIAYALIAFLGTVALARFLMRSSKRAQKKQPVDGETDE